MAQRVLLRGYADRLEIDDAGRGGRGRPEDRKYPPSKIEENPQLGLYQHAVDHGAVDDLVGAPASVGRRRALAAAQGDREAS